MWMGPVAYFSCKNGLCDAQGLRENLGIPCLFAYLMAELIGVKKLCITIAKQLASSILRIIDNPFSMRRKGDDRNIYSRLWIAEAGIAKTDGGIAIVEHIPFLSTANELKRVVNKTIDRKLSLMNDLWDWRGKEGVTRRDAILPLLYFTMCLSCFYH